MRGAAPGPSGPRPCVDPAHGKPRTSATAHGDPSPPAARTFVVRNAAATGGCTVHVRGYRFRMSTPGNHSGKKCARPPPSSPLSECVRACGQLDYSKTRVAQILCLKTVQDQEGGKRGTPRGLHFGAGRGHPSRRSRRNAMSSGCDSLRGHVMARGDCWGGTLLIRLVCASD